MAKKKKSKRSARRAQSQSQAAASQPQEASAPSLSVSNTSPVSAPQNIPSAPELDPRWAYAGRDVRRIIFLVTGCIIVEVLLYVLFTHTGFGQSIYSQIKI